MAVQGQISEAAQRLNNARNNLRKELEEVFPGQNVTVDRILDCIEELINAGKQHDRY